jgi:hypothetical protein
MRNIQTHIFHPAFVRLRSLELTLVATYLLGWKSRIPGD